VERVEPTILIIDTWRLLIGPVDENKSEKVLDGLKKLSQLRIKRPSMVIIIVHHLRKQGLDTGTRLRDDPYSWVESVSGHHALVGHVDWCYGLERETDVSGDELIIFGGVARNASQSVTLLEDDGETLRYEVVRGEDALFTILTGAERKIWDVARKQGEFRHTELMKVAKTTNKKAVTSVLRKAETQGVIERRGSLYVVRAA
jgi:hypothetical protein